MENDEYWLDMLLNSENLTEEQIKDAFKYAHENFMDMIKKDDFLKLDLESFKTLLRPDELLVTSEDIVYECVKRWLDFNKINPSDSLNSLLEVVRLPLVSPEILLSDVLSFAFPISDCQNHVIEALKWHIFPDQRSLIPKNRTTLRGKLSKRLLAVGCIAPEAAPIIELYDFNENKWIELKSLNTTKKNYATALVGRELLLIGGSLHSKATNSVISVNLMNGELTNCNPLNDSRNNCWATVVSNENSTIVYVAGGYGGDILHGEKPLKSVEKWDSKSRQWSKMAQMNVARTCCGFAYLEGKLYAAGGTDGNKLYNSLEVCDLKINVWKMKASMNNVRSHCTLAASEKYIFAIGGHNDGYRKESAISSIERYDPKTDVWTYIGNISSSGIVGASVVGNCILIGGGYESKIFEEYDIEKKRRKMLSPLNHNRDFVNMIPLPNNLSDCKFAW